MVAQHVRLGAVCQVHARTVLALQGDATVTGSGMRGSTARCGDGRLQGLRRSVGLPGPLGGRCGRVAAGGRCGESGGGGGAEGTGDQGPAGGGAGNAGQAVGAAAG